MAKLVKKAVSKVSRKTIKADHNASQVNRLGKLPYKPDSFTVSDVRKAVHRVKREMAASGGPT